MKSLVLYVVFVFVFINSAFAQTVYKIPFASKDNKIEMTVSNASTISAEYVNVKVTSCPLWVKMKEAEIATGEISAKEEKVFVFNFDIDKTAPVGKEGSIKFVITIGVAEKGMGETWSKEIKIKAGAPDNYELFQNFPNPFNPATTISYQLPVDSKATLKVYDILGREVLTLIDNNQNAGFHKVKFNGSDLASGIYIYRLIAKDKNSINKFISIKKMMLVK